MSLTAGSTSRGHVCASYLSYLQHLRVQPVEMEHELCQADEGQLDGEHLAEGPVICGVGESVESPLLQHAARNHVALNLLQDIPENLPIKKKGDMRNFFYFLIK